MADVFLSYAQADAKRAKQVADALEAKGWTVWWDVSLVAGDRFRTRIGEELHSARCVVVLWSATSIESDWVIDEADDGKKRRILVQALIEKVLPPHGFRQIQFANLIEWDNSGSGEFARLCAGISRHAPVTSNPSPLIAGKREGLGKTVDVPRVPSARTGISPTHAKQRAAPSRVQTAPAPTCTYTINRSSVSISGLGGSRLVKVSTAKGCAWTATTSASWISVTSGESGSGDGTVAFSVAANTGAARSGTLTIAGHSFTVLQDSFSPEAGRATSEKWKDLEQRFKDLNDATLVADLWIVTETDQRTWKVHGGSEKSRRDFLVLAELAGTLLTKSPRTLAKIDGTDVSDSRDPVHRWFYFLKWTGVMSNDAHRLEGTDDTVHISEIDNVAKASAGACAECAAYESIL